MNTNSPAIDAYTVMIKWVVPGIISFMFLFGISIAINARPDLKRSAWSGFMAGLVAFVIIVVTQLKELQQPTLFSFSSLPDFDLSTILPLVMIGSIVGFFLLWAVERSKGNQFIGAMILILTLGSLLALFSYIFDTGIREVAMLLALSTILGLLLFRTFGPNPNTLHGQPKDQEPYPHPPSYR